MRFDRSPKVVSTRGLYVDLGEKSISTCGLEGEKAVSAFGLPELCTGTCEDELGKVPAVVRGEIAKEREAALMSPTLRSSSGPATCRGG